MRINHNLSALNTWRINEQNNNASQHSIERLSSGLRVNRAGDDAAGLSISEKMRGQIRGLSQSSRNIQDAVSLIQTAEGGLQEVHSLLQRGRELAVQAANGTYTTQDKTNIQAEISQIIEEVDKISTNTNFNTIKLLDQTAEPTATNTLISQLKNSWIGNSLDRIKKWFGIDGASVGLDIKVVDGTPGGVTAYVSAAINGLPGVGTNLSLTVELADYDATNGTIGGLSADRTISHELTHAVMASTMNWSDPTAIPTWFKEGAAELIHGADERVAGDLFALGGNNATNRQALVDTVGGAWVSDSAHYSGAYAALRFAHDAIKAAGGTGIADVLTYLTGNPNALTLDDAFANASSTAFTGLADFVAKFTAAGVGGGEDYINTRINMSNADTGAIHGLDADGFAALDDQTVIDDGAYSYTIPFSITWPTVETGSGPLSMHVGANSYQTLKVALSDVGSSALGISGVSVTDKAETAITVFDKAISTVSAERARYGALQNRLEHTLNVNNNYNVNLTASEGRIRDADLAEEVIGFTKNNILSQAATSMLSQANQQPQSVLQLLRVS